MEYFVSYEPKNNDIFALFFNNHIKPHKDAINAERNRVAAGNDDEISRLKIRTLENLENAMKEIVETFNLLAAHEEKKFNSKRDSYKPADFSFLLRNLTGLGFHVEQLSKNTLSISVSGLSNSGKSTIVSSFVGADICPGRSEPLTCIPICYVHDPTRVEPELTVPMFQKLNTVVNEIKNEVRRREENNQNIRDKIPKVHFKELMKKIDNGFQVLKSYNGIKDIAQALIDINDILRIATLVLFENSKCWKLASLLGGKRGLFIDDLITVHINFSGITPDVVSKTSLWIFDTPPANEDGLLPLAPNDFIQELIDNSHFLMFTLDPRDHDSSDAVKFKKMIGDIPSNEQSRPLILATFQDLISANEDTQKANIANGIRSQGTTRSFPEALVFPVSGKRKLIGEKMSQYIDEHKQKPEIDDGDLARNWLSIQMRTASPEDQEDYYENLSVESLRNSSKKMIGNSKIGIVLEEVSRNIRGDGRLLQCAKAAEKTNKCCKELQRKLKMVLYGLTSYQEKQLTYVEECERLVEEVLKEQTELKISLGRKTSNLFFEISSSLDDLFQKSGLTENDLGNEFPTFLKSKNKEFQQLLDETSENYQKTLESLITFCSELSEQLVSKRVEVHPLPKYKVQLSCQDSWMADLFKNFSIRDPNLRNSLSKYIWFQIQQNENEYLQGITIHALKAIGNLKDSKYQFENQGDWTVIQQRLASISDLEKKSNELLKDEKLLAFRRSMI